MMMVLRYLVSYMAATAQLFMLFLTTVVTVAIDPIWLLVMLLLLAVAALAAMISVVNPPAPPYMVALLFRQVRIRYGLPAMITGIQGNDDTNNKKLALLCLSYDVRRLAQVNKTWTHIG